MNKSSWSVNLGCWGGVDVRLHLTLPLVMLSALLLSDDVANYRRAQFPIEQVALILLLGFASVAIHAASHVIVAGRYGLDTSELVLAPWGEWNGIRFPPRPKRR